MGVRRIPREDLPSDGVAIGGEDDCEHAYYERIGSDGGTNIYFRCLECSKVVLKYGRAAEGGPEERTTGDPTSELLPDSNSKVTQHPLVKGLSFDSGTSTGPGSSRDRKSGGRESGEPGLLDRLKSALRRLLGSDEK